MAYRQKVTNPDIRNITLKDLPEKTAVASADSIKEEATFTAHHPGADVRRIVIAALPLIILLVVASYLDATRHWVVPFAQRIMQLGS